MAGRRKGGRNFPGQYCIEDIDFWLNDPRLNQISDAARLFFFYAGMIAVKERRETLPAFWDARSIALASRLTPRYAKRWVDTLVQLSLLKVDDDGRITVCGVKGRHQNLRWKDGPYNGNNAVHIEAQTRNEKHYDAPALQAPDASVKVPIGRTWSDKVMERVRSRRVDDAA